MRLGYTKDVTSITLALSEFLFYLLQWKSGFLWGVPQGKEVREAPGNRKAGSTTSDLIYSKELLCPENHISESESSSFHNQVFV